MPEHESTGECGTSVVVLLANLVDRTAYLYDLLTALDANDRLHTLVTELERTVPGDHLATVLAALADGADALGALVADLVDSPDRMGFLLAELVERTAQVDALIGELESAIQRSLSDN